MTIQQPSVTKSIVSKYEVRSARGDHATIHLESGRNADDEHPDSGWGRIKVEGSFGPFAAYWNACGSDFPEFLASIDFDYAMKNMRQYDHREFDKNATMQLIRNQILHDRRKHTLNKDDAKKAWDLVAEAEKLSPTRSVIRLMDSQLEFYNDVQVWAPRTKYRDNCVEFWEHIWPLFITEITKPAEQALAPVKTWQPERRLILKEVLKAADAVRLEFSKRYADNLKHKTSPMHGNLDWMRLEGAVRVVDAVRKMLGQGNTATPKAQFNSADEKARFEMWAADMKMDLTTESANGLCIYTSEVTDRACSAWIERADIAGTEEFNGEVMCRLTTYICGLPEFEILRGDDTSDAAAHNLIECIKRLQEAKVKVPELSPNGSGS